MHGLKNGTQSGSQNGSRSGSRNGSLLNILLAVLCVAVVLFMTIAAAVRFSTPISGVPRTDVGRLDSGWYYEQGDVLTALDAFPCSVDVPVGSLYLVHELSDINWNDDDVLALQTRYASIRVWADGVLIYEAAQGEEHALSTMWHFVPLEMCKGAAQLRVELTRYDQKTGWSLPSVLMDHSDAVLMYLIGDHAPAILFWLVCMLFTALLLFIITFMAIRKVGGISAIVALTSFIFLSGMWILLDSKVTTLFGGNYALTYFFSYFAFYLMPVPFFCHVRLVLDRENRALRYISWVGVLNAAICMGLHFFGVVHIRNTTFTVHILILFALIVSVRLFFISVVKHREKKLICTFFGILFVYATSFISIVLYYFNRLPPTNNAVLYSRALLVIIICMMMDVVSSFSRLWKEKQYIDQYRRLAVNDSMTSLKNRNAYESRLKHLVSDPPDKLIFIYFDVDNLKIINDTYGHHVGDQALNLFSQCAREVFSSMGSCYRIGGDEFCVIITSECNVERKLRQLDELLKLRCTDGFQVTVSHGWAESSFEGGIATEADITELQKTADRNLYKQKNQCKKC